MEGRVPTKELKPRSSGGVGNDGRENVVKDPSGPLSCLFTFFLHTRVAWAELDNHLLLRPQPDFRGLGGDLGLVGGS